MTTYLITGAAGFIGSNYLRYLLRRDPEARAVSLDLLTYAGNPENLAGLPDDGRHIFVQGDICDGEGTQELFRRYDPDVVVHFAAESHVDRSILDPQAFVRTNVMGTVSLLSRCREAWYDEGKGAWRPGKKYVQVSTDEVYGALGKEGYFTERTPVCPRSPYSASKAAADHFVMAYRDTYGMPVQITRCSNNYGPRQFPEKLIPLTILNAMAHRPVPVYGDGLQVRDWLYVLDHCRAIDLVVRRGRDGEIYNIGGRSERTNLDLVRTVLRVLREKLQDDGIGDHLIRHIQDRPGHDRRYAIDPGKIEQELGWKPETSFEEGISRTVDWYLSHRDWLDHAVSGAYRGYYDKMYGNRL